MTAITTTRITLDTEGEGQIFDLTPDLRRIVAEKGLRHGNVLVFVPGSTGGVTTVEHEPGLVEDLGELFERLAPRHAAYHHEETWHDGNGYAHVRASLLGPSLVVPVESGELLCGTWQQVIFIDFDNKPRRRNLVIQVFGERE